MEKYSKKIDDFLDGLLSDQQKKAFINELSENVELKKEFEFQKDLRNSLKDEGYFNLRNKLKKKNEEIKNAPMHVSYYKKTVKRYIAAVAALVAIIIVSGLLYFLINTRTLTPDQIVQKYYYPAKSIQQVRSIDQNDIIETKNAFELYNNEKYSEALELFLLVENEIISNFYSGICYFEIGDFQHASECFEFVVIDNNNLLIEQAEWHLALSYMKLGKIQNAKDIFLRLSSSENPYAINSKEILKNLQ